MVHVARRTIGRLLASALVGGALFAVAPSMPAHAAKANTCAAFVARLGTRTFSGEDRWRLSARRVDGRTMMVDGRFVEFLVDLDTFRVRDYTLTGARSARDITGGERTVIFASKTPQHSSDKPLTGALELRLADETIRLERGGASVDLKIQAKDCPQGGLFQMEPEPGMTFVHQLGAGFHYFTDDLGRTLFTNGTVVGRESPELASLVSRDDDTSTWSVDAGGRMGMVLGEDATQA